MAKLELVQQQPSPSTALVSGIIVTELEDYSKKIEIPDSLIRGGLVAIFRDPTHRDLEALNAERAKSNEISALKKFGCSLCVQWGEKPGITPPQWDGLRMALSLALIEVLNTFFPGVSAES